MEKKLLEGWEIKSIDEVLIKKMSGEWGTEALGCDGIHVLRTTNFTNEGKLNLNDVIRRNIPKEIVNEKKLKYGDIILEKSGGSDNQPVGRVVYFDICTEDEYLCNNFTQILRVNNNFCYSKYLLYCLFDMHRKGLTKRYQNNTTGIRNLQVKNYFALKIPLPPLPTQRRIVSILEKAEETKRLRAQADELSDRLLQSVFLEMFYKNNTDYYNWKLFSIQDFAYSKKGSMRTGPFGSNLKHSEFINSGIAVLGIDNVVNNRFQWAQRRYISKEKYEELKCYTVYPNDVIITIMATIGKSCVVPNDIPLSISTKHLAVITCDKTKCDPQFLSYSIILHPEIKRQMSQANIGAIMDGLNLKIIKSLEIPLPPLPLQQKFARIVEKIESMRQSQNQSKQQIEDLFSALMQKAFRGEI